MAFDPMVIDKRPRSLAHMFLAWVETQPDADAYYYPIEGGWQQSSWAETHTLVEGLAAGLIALGIQPEDRVAIVASTRFESVLAFLATQFAGGAVTAVDPTSTDVEVSRALRDSGARVVIAEDYETVHLLWRIRAEIREVTKVVQMDGEYPDARVLTLEGLLALGHEQLAEQPRVIAQRLYAVRRQGLAAIVYTADRDGPPRGVRLHHSALTYQGAAVASLGELSQSDLLYLCLPLAHTYGQALLAVQLACGFPAALEGRPDHVIDHLAVIRPTWAGLTPRLLEEIRGRVDAANRSGMLRRRAAERAFDVARQVHDLEAEAEKVPGRLARRHRRLDRRVLSDIRDVFGDRFRFLVTPGVGLDSSTAELLDLAGVTVLEAYGRPETAGAVSVARPADRGSGTAGRPLPGTEVRLDEGGEVLVSGPGVMEGYHRRRTDTAAALRKGWLRTGDTGVLDDLGRLRVLGRMVGTSEE